MSDLPKGWAPTTVKELAGSTGLFVDGDWVESKDQDPNGDIRLIQLADIGDGSFLDKSNRWINEGAFAQLRCTELATGDILIARMPDPLGRACLMPALEQRCVTVVDVAALRVDPRVANNRWVMHTINAPQLRAEIGAQASGTTRKRISRGNLGGLQIPLPPELEQKRIADKLDTVLTRVDAVNARLARVAPILKRFRQSVLTAATSGRLTEDWRQEVLGTQQHECQITEISVPYPQRITGPKGWTPHIFDQVVDLVGGSQPPKTTFVHEVQPDYVRLIQIRDYKSDRHLTYIPRALARRLCSTTDVMIGRYGPPIFQILRGLEGAYNVALMKAVPKDGLLTNDYLYYWLQRDDLLRFVEAGSDRTAGQDGVRKEHLVKYPVFVPSVQEQAEIVRRVEALFAFADRLEARLQTAKTATERLTPALLAKAFRGELVPQDPNDEPASELLRRLQHEAPLTNAKRGRKSAA